MTFQSLSKAFLNQGHPARRMSLCTFHVVPLHRISASAKLPESNRL